MHVTCDVRCDVAERIFCNVENRAFDSDSFTSGPDGITIHVLADDKGHTLDGWVATYQGSKNGGHWELEDITIEEPAIDVLPSE